MPFKIFAAAFMLLSVASAAHASPITISASQAVQGRPGASGLIGTYYKAAPGSTAFDIEDTLKQLQAAHPAGTFTSTSINYGGNDGSTIISFLGADSASYTGRKPAASDLSDAIIDLSGYLFVPTASTISFALSHDDSAQLKIGNRVIVSAGCCGTDTAAVSFEKSGYYAIDLIYSNTIYGGGVGGASVALTENGVVLTSAALVQSVPEPASLTLLGGAVATLLAGLRVTRRRSVPVLP